MVITIPFLLVLAVCIVGLIMYIVAAHPKVQEAGRIMFAFGLLVILLTLAGSRGGP